MISVDSKKQYMQFNFPLENILTTKINHIDFEQHNQPVDNQFMRMSRAALFYTLMTYGMIVSLDRDILDEFT